MILVEVQKDDIKSSLNEEVNGLTGAKEKRLYLSGPFTVADLINRNKRLYPKHICDPAIKLYNENFISTNQALGEIMHPDTPVVDLKSAAIRVVKYQLIPGTNIYEGKALVLSTPTGKIIEALVRDGCNFGVSTRGEGDIRTLQEGTHEVINWSISAVDVVGTPSVMSAMMEKVYENKIYDFGFDKKVINETRKRLDAITNSTYFESDRFMQFARVLYEMIKTLEK